MSRAFSPADARRYYDRHAGKQDRQGWYEDAALAELAAAGRFGEAHAVLDLGAGTGGLAETLLGQYLPGDARYLALDISRSMLLRARPRLAGFPGRARLVQADASRTLPVRSACMDRVVAAYLIDLLPGEAAEALVAEARRVLWPDGLICLAGLACAPAGALPRLTSRLWAALHRLAPHRVGGCRPVRLAPLLKPAQWEIRHRGVVAPYGVPSEVVVARRR